MGNELFETMPVPKAYMKLAMPVVLGMVVSLIYNMVDTYFIALTGSTDLIAGVSLCAPVFTLMLALGDIWGLGGSSLISRLLGGGKREDATRISIFCFWGAIFLGILAAALLLAGRGQVLGLLGADAGTLPYAQGYYSYLVLGSPFLIFSLVPSNLLRTEGAANASMVGSILGAVLNIILDPIFIFGLGLGASGAAIASVLGYVATDIFYVIYILKKCPGLSLNLGKMKISGSEVGAIMAIGLPASVTNFMQSVGMTITNRSLLPYGNEPIAMMGIVLKVVNIAALVLVGLAFGGQPLIGYTYGARNRDRLKQTLKFAYAVLCGTAVVMTLILSIFARPIMSAFIEDPALIAMGAQMLRLQLIGMVCMGACLVCTCTFQSTGKGLPAFLLSICRQGVVYALVMLISSGLFGYMGVISAQAATDVVTLLIAVCLMKVFLGKELENQ